MSPSSTDSKAFSLALLGASLIAVAFVAYTRWSAPGAEPTGIEGPEPALNPDLPSLHPSPAPSEKVATPVIATVFECDVGGQKVFGDHPCAEDARIREVMAPNGMRATRPMESRATTLPETRHGAIEAGGSAGLSSQSNESLCTSIDEEIDRINARMRRGYNAGEGEWYRERLRKLDDARWTANCRKH